MFRIFRDKPPTDKKQGNSEKPQLTASLEHNMTLFKNIFDNNDTAIFRRVESIHGFPGKYCLIFMDGMVDKEKIHETIILPLMNLSMERVSLETLMSKVINSSEVQKTHDIDLLIKASIYGDTVLLMEGAAEALVIETKGWAYRSVEEPISESVVRGPREGFTESINVNLALIRRKIVNPDLKFQYMEVGTRTKTKICICYIQSLASEKILGELKKRLEKVDIDGVLESGYVEELIRDEPLSSFRTIGSTERPDVVAARLLEGRIAVVFDGTPFALTLPFLFMEFFQANEDYYQSFIMGSINRFLRVVCFFLSTSVPAIYLALATYHQEMIPTPLLFSISAARQGVPFPTVFETLAMGITFEVLREAGVRLPKPIGQAVSIVGALVIGEAAVSARLVSAPIVIVTALTGIASFLVPKMISSLILIRIIFILLASVLGLYGYIFGLIGLFIHLMSMRSFGVPYMLNIGSIRTQDIKDTMVRAPWWYMQYRPKLIGSRNSSRRTESKPQERG